MDPTEVPVIGYADLLLARQRWVRITIETYAFGMYTVMVAMTLYFLFKRGNVWANSRLALCYTLFMTVCAMLWFYASNRLDEVATIEYLVPTASSQLAIADYCSSTDLLSSTTSFMMQFASDLLMLYRAWVIVDGGILVMAIPAALVALGFALGLIGIAGCSTSVHIPAAIQIKLGTAFYAVIPTFNILVTLMIAYKLIRQHLHVRKAVAGPLNSVYISIVGIIAESAIIYSVATLTMAVLIARGNLPAQRWWQGVMTSTFFLCPAWIILRIAMGTAYARSGANTQSSSSRSKNVGSLVFGTSQGRSTLVGTRPGQSVDKFEEGAYDMDRIYPESKTDAV